MNIKQLQPSDVAHPMTGDFISKQGRIFKTAQEALADDKNTEMVDAVKNNPNDQQAQAALQTYGVQNGNPALLQQVKSAIDPYAPQPPQDEKKKKFTPAGRRPAAIEG